MAEDFKVTGADDFYKLSKALKAAGDKGLRTELNKAVKAAARPVIKDVRDAAGRDLPQRGGLARRMSKAKSDIRTKTGRNPGVSVVFPGKQPGYIDGRIRHPVFAGKYKVPSSGGKKKTKTIYAASGARNGVKFVEQKVDGDWFDGTLEREGPKVLPDIERALQSIADEVVRRAR